MKKILVGNLKNGWEVNIIDKTIKIYHFLSVYEKIKKEKNYKEIKFSDIKIINVGWNNVPCAFGENQHFIRLKLNLTNGEQIDFDGTSNGISKEEFKQGILLLKSEDILFDDPFNILKEVLNSDKKIWEILNDAELKRRSQN